MIVAIVTAGSFDFAHVNEWRSAPAAQSSADFAAWSQARAAWANFCATILAAVASVSVAIAAVFIAFWMPWSARRANAKASLYYLGHALAASHAFIGSVDGANPGQLIFLQEVLDKSQPSINALNRFFDTKTDDQDLIKIALNLQSMLLLFRAYIEFGTSTGNATVEAARVQKKINELREIIDRATKEFGLIQKKYNVNIDEEVDVR